MKRTNLLTLVSNLALAGTGVLLLSATSAGATTWARTFGGTGFDVAVSVRQTAEGGYILAGISTSFGSGGSDAWVLKLDAAGDAVWRKAYGGAADDAAVDVRQTTDGGYVVAGHTSSFGAGNRDVWLLKLDELGDIDWQTVYGGPARDEAYSVQLTADEGFLLAGRTESFGAGNGDVWVLKLDDRGRVLWRFAYGGPLLDEAHSVQPTSDGGWIVAGDTYSFGAGNADAWVLKLDRDGGIEWQKAYGSETAQHAHSVLETSDGMYVVAGSTAWATLQKTDAWVLKLASSGDPIFSWRYGLGAFQGVVSIEESVTGGYVTLGRTETGPSGDSDFRLMKLGALGDVLWSRTFGGSVVEYPLSVHQQADGGWVATGYTESFGAGMPDVWVLKLDGMLEIDPACPLIGEVSPMATAFPPEIADTPAIAMTTSHNRRDADAVAVDTSAGTQQQCLGAGQFPPKEVSPPGAFQPLVFLDKETLLWELGTASGSDTFNLYRGVILDLHTKSYGNCFQIGLLSNTASEPSVPIGNSGYFYLVTGKRGLLEGPLGRESAGTARVNVNPCP